MPTLRLYDVSKSFGPTTALESVSLDVAAGEVHALIGENGAGKSTLLNVLAGSVWPDRGVIKIDDRVYAPATPQEARRHGVALIHQELSLFPHLSVAENILVGIEPARFGFVDRARLHARAFEVLKSFGHPEIQPDRRVMDLPIAARQIVEICRAVASEASIILMDEPTSCLQRADVDRLFSFVRQLTREGVTVIYISHFLEEVREIAERFTVLRDGRSVATGDLRSITDEELVRHIVGRSIENLFPVRQKPRNHLQTLFEIKGLSAPPAVKDASLSLRGGEVLGIAGLIGTGRTELVRAIFGLDKASGGKTTVRQRPNLNKLASPRLRLRQGFGYLSEDRAGEGLTLSLSIADNITLARFSTCANRWGWLNLNRQREQVTKWIGRLSIKVTSPWQSARSLSGGNQQKVALARLLHQDAEILLLDEPTRGIDIGSKAQIYEAIAECAANNKAVLMISSYLPELFGMCDRLAVMNRGRLSVARPISEWTPESVMQAAIANGKASLTSHSEWTN